ncbi:MAG: glycoside hydrolase family 2 protein, partial [Clostridia bacterium]|nr:glycoside hydrolase family 2 protein [Clostridia bacterium]
MKKYLEQPGLFSLNKGWRFSKQDYSILPSGITHDEVYGYSKGGAQRGPAEAGFDDGDWEKVELPHDWVTEHAPTPDASPNMGYKHRGIGWYRMRFGLEEEDCDKQILLEFEGMSMKATVFINGMLMKRSYSGYNSFYVDITDIVHFGSIPNTLAVRIQANAWEGWWYEGAGIYRNAWLVKKAPVHIAYHGVFASPQKLEDGTWQLLVSTEIENSFEHGTEIQVCHSLIDSQGQIVASTSSKAFVNGFEMVTNEQKMVIQNPQIWDLVNPYLYELKTSIFEQDQETDYLYNRIGFRTIAWETDTGFWLNGKQIKLKGFCNHQDHAGVGVAVPYSLKEFRLAKLKEIGANAYRLSHNPDPEILDLCDQMGILVMEENRTFSSAADNLADVKDIIRRARNHPSVILYSIFNEEPLQGTYKGRRIAGKLKAVVKEMDQTRPVLGALNGGYLEEDGASTILDGVGINYNPKRYDDFHEKFPQIPLLGSETASAFMVRGEYETQMEKHLIDNYDIECAPWGNTTRDAWRYIAERPFVAGTFVWTGFDYRGEPTPFEWPSVATFFGVYDSCGFEKDACYLYRAFWTDEPMIHLVSPWCYQDGIGEQIKVMIDSNCDHVQLFVNQTLIGEKDIDKYEQAEFIITKELGELKAVGFKNGKEVALDIQVTSGAATRLKLETQHLYQNGSAVRSDGHDVIIIKAQVVDDADHTVPDADHLIHFNVENGIVIGVGNGDPNSHEPDKASYRKAFHGLAQAIIKPTGNKTVSVNACAEGLEGAKLCVNVEQVDEIPNIRILDERIVDGWKLYHKISEIRPDPLIKTKRNDMNSFEPVAISNHSLPELSGKLNHYAMYRTSYTLGSQRGKLFFCAVDGYVWIYLNGNLVSERTDSYGGEIIVEIPAEIDDEVEITVIIQAANPEYPVGGISSPVF